MKRSEIIGAAGPDRDVRIKRYDFRRPDKFSMEQIRSLSLVHEQAARDLTLHLSARLMREVVVKLELVDQMTYDEFLRQFSKEPALYSMYGDTRSVVSSVIHFSNTLTFALIHYLCGGASPVPQSDRDVSDMEMSLSEGVCLLTASSLKRAWKIVDIPWPGLRQIETNKLFASITSPGEMIVYVRLSIKFEDLQENIDIAIPYLFLEPHLQKLTPAYLYRDIAADALGKSAILGNVVQPRSESVIVLPRIKPADVYKLKPGSRLGIPLRGKGSRLVQVRTGGVIGAALPTVPDQTLKQRVLEESPPPASPAIDSPARETRTVPDSLKEAEALPKEAAEEIARLLKSSLPQMQAAAISLLSPECAAAVLAQYNPDTAAGLFLLLSGMKRVDHNIHRELAGFLLKMLSLQGDPSWTNTGGEKRAAEILRHTDEKIKAAISLLNRQ